MRPVLNLEPNYEGHRNRAPGATGVFTDLDVCRAAWYSLLSTPTAGLTYGVHGIWGWHPRALEPMTHPGTGVGPAWYNAMKLPGSRQLKYMAEFFEALEWTKLRPAQGLLASQPGAEDVTRWVAVARGDSIVAYSGAGDPVELRAEKIGAIARARWFSPRRGRWVNATLRSGQTLRFDPPSPTDWVLLLDLP